MEGRCQSHRHSRAARGRNSEDRISYRGARRASLECRRVLTPPSYEPALTASILLPPALAAEFFFAALLFFLPAPEPFVLPAPGRISGVVGGFRGRRRW